MSGRPSFGRRRCSTFDMVERIENGLSAVNSRMSTMAGPSWHKDEVNGIRIFLLDARRR